MDTIRVVCGIIFDNEKVFICRRKEGKSLAGYWEFPGGKIEESESNEQALKRELHEELEMEVVIKDFIGQSNYNYSNFQIELLGYKCQLINYHGKLTDHDTFEWIDSLKLGEYNFAPADIPLIKFLLDKKPSNRT
ncbi:(deoxy)nucleoside triphosphate pyrophosphohydrolase [Algoriphagus sp. PAP.12]|uniref:(deoxy)nucleoside triphosphate pyrophosphohydrolase n=1 Tax=Algoriphagus sp. PAP.12 TaxID=2996678 RepID=UPI00227AFF81|nr:(deoxy)nucleoside triphosphate pyrophosphohydrolase [Algoriphagus sp. PAP.12]